MENCEISVKSKSKLQVKYSQALVLPERKVNVDYTCFNVDVFSMHILIPRISIKILKPERKMLQIFSNIKVSNIEEKKEYLLRRTNRYKPKYTSIYTYASRIKGR